MFQFCIILRYSRKGDTMTRMSKQGERRNTCPKKCRVNLTPKTGPIKDKLENGFKLHVNAMTGETATSFYIPKMVK